jgi:hypothetical protein
VRLLAVALLLSGALAACGGADGDGDDHDRAETSTTVDADPCDAARAVADLDDDFQGEVNDAIRTLLEAPSQAQADAALEDLVSRLQETDLDPLLEAYRRLETSLSGEPSDAARTLRTFTEGFVDDLRGASTSDEIVELLEGMANDDATVAAGRAALDLDEWSRTTCDVVIAD